MQHIINAHISNMLHIINAGIYNMLHIKNVGIFSVQVKTDIENLVFVEISLKMLLTAIFEYPVYHFLRCKYYCHRQIKPINYFLVLQKNKQDTNKNQFILILSPNGEIDGQL